MIVKELRELLADLPEDFHVLLHDEKSEHWYEPTDIKYRMVHSVILKIKKPTEVLRELL